MAARAESRCMRGFSLLELLVALAVFALAVVALLHLAGENARTAALVEQRALAGIVADNRATEALLLAPAQLGAATSGSESLGGRDWRWQRTLAGTDDPGIVRVEVQVRAANESQVLAEAQVFRSAR